MSIVNSVYTVKSRTSAYQTEGKPLSKEALYKAKLRYGIYQSPSAKSIGVPNSASASDTAALLAASTDLTVDTYKRTVAADAHTAALLAREDTAPQKWVRESIGNEAASAAAAAESFVVKPVHVETKDAGSSSAASAVMGLSGRSIGSLASSNLASLYEFDSVRNGEKKTTLDLSKITKASKERADARMNDRLNPEKDPSRYGILTQSKLDDASLEAFAAVGALASQNYKPPVDENLEARSVFKNSMVTPAVLAKASLNADETMKRIEKQLDKTDILRNVEFNKIAYEIASRHGEVRNVNAGKVNLGGGLFMTQEELNAIAQKFVSPVLDQINKTAESQRAKDAAAQKAAEEQKAKHEQFKQEQRAKHAEEQRLKTEAKQKRKKELADEKVRARETKLALEKQKKEELEAHKGILESKQKAEVRKKEELLKKKESEEKRLAAESAEADTKRKEELTAAERERDERLTPILADLKQQQDKLAVLNEEKAAVQEITDTHITNTENSQKLLEASQVELANAKENLEQLKLDIETTTSEQEKLAKEAEIKAAEVDVANRESEELHAEAALKKAEIEKVKSVVENERLRIELELENEKIGALKEEKEIAETLPPSEKARAEDAAKETIAKTETQPAAPTATATSSSAKATSSGTATHTASGEPRLYRSMVDDALNWVAPTKAEKKETDGGELKQTFSGFSQGSDARKDELADSELKESSDKHKSIFKEEF